MWWPSPTSISNIGAGDFVSFIGPSGCGKTTFLRAIADLEQPTSARIALNCISPEAARKSRALENMMFQKRRPFSVAHHREECRLTTGDHGAFRRQRAERIERTMELVNFWGFESKYPWQLSGGMQQRASIARALAYDADLLLMDEPFGALDEIVRDHLNPNC